MDYYYSDDIKEEVKGFIPRVSSPNISIKLIKSFKVAKVSLCPWFMFKSKLVIIDSKIAAISSDR
jgi:hypothetical protein